VDICHAFEGYSKVFQHALEKGILHHEFAQQIPVLILRALDYIEKR
jgi:hypothetical protein